MPRITASKIVLLIALSFCITVIYHFPIATRSSKEYDEYGNEYENVASIESDIKNVRRLLDEVPDPSQNRLQFLKLDEHAFAFSAYTDDRNGNMGYKYVRVLMFITSQDNFSCEINGRKSTDVSLYEFSENHKMKWQMFILNCKLPDGIDFNNVSSVKVIRSTTKQFVDVPIRYRIQDEKIITPDEYDYKMSICVPALFGNGYDAKRIVEFIELNTLQGIEKIYIYTNQKELDGSMKKTLKYYSDNHKITLIDYTLPFREDGVWYHGQLATVTDCLLRNTGITKYTFFNDFDEFFVPVIKSRTLFETISGLFEDPTIGSQRTALKYINAKIKSAPYSLKNIVSEKRIETRFTKCVVRPEMVFEQGIHHTSRVIQDNYKTVSHGGSLLRVYHYKDKKYCCEDESLLKKRHGDQLREKFDSVVGLLDL
ncbi:Beta-1,4-galactosyltransferase galt-1 [Caenorhabditis elegans]|uniref:Beta-1,4-galactosyltransferase galt-1 n=1 Tax=Caenorhabditis elegans TaxID=6239 RepID=GALT1_CAEEL|nr:Beta-1,4-galactosyltransferase galt-1 [Caenorhabditis elegans]O16374.4 RecName: Full=Beta-1,4-galactosyltransferase galt-1 [Caenorhabditis elegans]CCD64148.1 Beta-1,4-galactosyltransferase galt-1 [Caenorhabditis elegans]|eukprot:NP_504545.2 Beta-1,4-galactosyltransferase galt-1 [Caenorhabditis elegans]